MGTVRLTPELEEFIKGKSLSHESMDSTLRRLLGYEQAYKSRVYVKRDSLMPREILMAFILDCFRRGYDITRSTFTSLPHLLHGHCTPKHLRDSTNFNMIKFVNPSQWPADFELNSRNKQPRWKNRFSGMLQEMIKNNILEHSSLWPAPDDEVIRYNYKGGHYLINEHGLSDFQRQLIKTHGSPFDEPNVWAAISEYHLEDEEVSSNPGENDVDFEAVTRLFWSISRLLETYGLNRTGDVPEKFNTAHFNERNEAENRKALIANREGLSALDWLKEQSINKARRSETGFNDVSQYIEFYKQDD